MLCCKFCGEPWRYHGTACKQKPAVGDTPESAFARGFKAGFEAAENALGRAKLDAVPPPYRQPVHLEDLVGLFPNPIEREEP